MFKIVVLMVLLLPLLVIEAFSTNYVDELPPNSKVTAIRLTDGRLEIFFRRPQVNFVDGRKEAESAWNVIYVAKDGEIVRDKKVTGKITPRRIIPEVIEWEE